MLHILSSSIWIKEAWKREVNLEAKSIKKEAKEALKERNINVEFREDGVWLERQQKRLMKGNQKTVNERSTKAKRCKVKCMKNKMKKVIDG